jgi:hypothetical protein
LLGDDTERSSDIINYHDGQDLVMVVLFLTSSLQNGYEIWPNFYHFIWNNKFYNYRVPELLIPKLNTPHDEIDRIFDPAIFRTI